MTLKKKYWEVTVAIQVEAETSQEAEEQVRDLMSYAFEVSNDAGIFTRWDILEVQS